MKNRARASSSRSSASNSNSSVTIGDESPRAGVNRGAADGPDRRVHPNAAAAVTNDGRARGRRNHGRTIARGPRAPPAITDPGSVARGRATGSARDRARVAIGAPDRRPGPPTGNGPHGRALADGSHARIPERGGEAADRAASRREERNAGDRARERVVAREIADDQDPTSPAGVNDGTADPGRGTEVESHDPSRTIAMVRSRHIDTGIEVRTCS